MARTYLQLVNDVLRELRESDVLTVSASEYSTLIGQFVNSAKRDVENAWRWDALRQTVPVTTVVNQCSYTVAGTNDRSEIMYGYNTTSDWDLTEQTFKTALSLSKGNLADANVSTTGPASAWAPAGNTAGVLKVFVWPKPSAIETLSFQAVIRPDDLVSDGDTVLVPDRPIVETAIARARSERGEDGGVTFQDQALFARAAAADAIALDASRHPEDTAWEAV